MADVTITVSAVELFCALRHARSQRAAVWDDVLTIRERLASCEDAALDQALNILMADVSILDLYIMKLWRAVGAVPVDAQPKRE